MVGKGQLEDIGLLGLRGQEAWFYPSYVEAQCPGLPNWEALKGCAELFATPETAPKGRIVDYPEEWTPDTTKMVDALGLDLVPVPAGGEGAIVAEVKSAIARKEPVLVYYWEPTWAVLEYDLRAVQLPVYDEKCETDPSWGINSEKTFDCAPSGPGHQEVRLARVQGQVPSSLQGPEGFSVHQCRPGTPHEDGRRRQSSCRRCGEEVG